MKIFPPKIFLLFHKWLSYCRLKRKKNDTFRSSIFIDSAYLLLTATIYYWQRLFIIDSDYLLLAATIYYWQRLFIIDSDYLLLTATIYYWQRLFIIDSEYLLLTANIYYWKRLFIVESDYLLLAATIYHWQRLFIIDSDYLLLTATIYYWQRLFIIDSNYLLLTATISDRTENRAFFSADTELGSANRLPAPLFGHLPSKFTHAQLQDNSPYIFNWMFKLINWLNRHNPLCHGSLDNKQQNNTAT